MSLLPGLDSYRGRYAYFALIAGLVLIIVAYLGWDYVNRTSRIQIAQIEARAMIAGVLSDALTHLNLAAKTGYPPVFTYFQIGIKIRRIISSTSSLDCCL